MKRMLLMTLALMFGLAACSSLPSRPESPRITLVGLKPVSVELFEQRYQVRLRVKNPNTFVLPIRGIDFTLAINGQAFADGVSSQAVDVPAYGEALVEVEVSSSLLQVFRQLQSLDDSQSPGFEYRISGNVATGDYRLRLPFDYSGELLLPKSNQSGAEKGVKVTQ